VQQLALAMMRGIAERGARVGWAAGAPPMVLLHGLGDSLAGWAQVAGALSRKFEVHLPAGAVPVLTVVAKVAARGRAR
jgi:pimeloyl-ACP methyl ester carboxylesterase